MMMKANNDDTVYYVLFPEAMLGSTTSDLYWTTSQHEVMELIAQNAHVEYDILEITAKSMVELFSICLNEYNIALDQSNRLKHFHTNTGLSFITSADYICNATNQYEFDNIIRILISSFINIQKLKKYVTSDYQPHLDIFLQLVMLYISRLVLFNNIDIQELPYTILEKLKFIPPNGKGCVMEHGWYYTEVDDIIDDNLLFYISEFGW